MGKTKQNIKELTTSAERLENFMQEIPKFEQAAEVEKNLQESIKNVGLINFEQIKNESYDKAKETVQSYIDYYIVDEQLKEHPIIKSMFDADVLTLAELLIDMKTAEHIMMKVSEEIDRNNNMHFKMLESYTKMQDSKMNIIKHMKQVELVIRKNYSDFQTQYYMNQERNSESQYVIEAPAKQKMLSADSSKMLGNDTVTITQEKTTVKATSRGFAQQMQNRLKQQIISSNQKSEESEDVVIE